MTAPRASLALSLGRDLLFAILACAAAVLVSLSFQLEMTKDELRKRSLDEAARYIAVRLKVDPDGTARLVSPSGSSWATMGYPAIAFDRDGRILYQRPAGLTPALVEALSEQRLRVADQPHRLGMISFFSLALGEKRIVGAALHTGPDNGERVIEVFKDENAPDVLVDDIVREFPYRSMQVVFPVFALLLIAAGGIIWRRTRPIAAVSALAETIGPNTLNIRLPEDALPPEVVPIVRSVNGALARLQRAAGVQREFLRRAAHQLRTPLTVLSARAELLEDNETSRDLRADIRELSHIISQLLQLNEIDALPDSGEALADLGAVGEAVRDALAPRAAMRSQRIALAHPSAPVLVRANPNVVEIGVVKLVENALRQSPAGSTIDLRIGSDAQIEVVDAGPGVAEELRDKIFEPFWSGDPQGTSPGLGLTIARRVAERSAATLTVDAAPGGGAIFAMRFHPVPKDASPHDPDGAIGIPASLMLRRRREALEHSSGPLTNRR